MAAWDPYTGGHQDNVAELSARLGVAPGLDDGMVLGLKLGATLHGLGKIAIPRDLLRKHGQLTDTELAQLRSHAVIGAQIASRGRWPWPWPWAELIHQHHERLDGTGYPRGLRGGRILLEARIIAVADVDDAIRHDRPCRPAPGKGHAMQVITAGRGTAFDPDVLDVLGTGFDLRATAIS